MRPLVRDTERLKPLADLDEGELTPLKSVVVGVVGEDPQLQTIIITRINSDAETITVILCIFYHRYNA
jgi:hypothetical protein